MADINLLPTEERSAESFENIRHKVLWGSIGFLVFTAISALVILGFYSTLASKRATLVSQIESKSSEINSLKPTEELIVVVKEKASNADKILNARKNLADVFGSFSQLVPQGVYFSDIKISGGKVVLSGKARTSADIAGLISSMTSAKGAEIVNNVTVDSLSSDDGGAYAFVVTLQLVGSKT